uniref:Phosphoinositide phospholipase C n=1 Tax=Daphnia magna TaxID=35525 RepID=A0A0P6F9A0_9CRUS
MASSEIRPTEHSTAKDIETSKQKCHVDREKISQPLRKDLVILLQNGAWFLEIGSSNDRRVHLSLDKNAAKLLARFVHGSNPAKQVYLTDITDVRYGWKTDVFSENARKKFELRFDVKLKEDCCLSIIYGRQRQSLDLQANDPTIAQIWVNNVSFLIDEIRALASSSNKSEWLRRAFKDADTDRSGFLNFSECCRLLSNLNVNIGTQKAAKIFQLSYTNSRLERDKDVLDEKEFLQFYNLVSERTELNAIFQDYANGKANLSDCNLANFLKEEQGIQNADLHFAQMLIKQHKLQKTKAITEMTLPEFKLMMNSPFFDILKKEHLQVNQDMNRPLSDYYISCSHNTYLMGDQLMGVSSIEGYASALERGCRCLELDLWDGPNSQPIVYHGYTKTSKLLARDVLAKGIKPFAFKFSPFPLILSAENHLSRSQQTIFAQDLRQIFGPALFWAVEENAGNQASLLSPNQLRGKIIIKVTGAKVCSPALQCLINCCKSFPNFEKMEGQKVGHTTPCYSVVSMSEIEATTYLKKLPKETRLNPTSQTMIRVYPTATRIASSNFSPVYYWNFGCQMVALNFQTPGKFLEINVGRFRRNGNCGYVLKPDWLLGKIARIPSSCKSSKMLQLRIISVQNLPKRPGQTKKGYFYVSVQIDGHPSDSYKFRTPYLMNGNGLNPFWNEITDVKVCFPELAVICFSVKYVDTFKIKQPLASYCLPVESLASGYRHAPLSSDEIISSIFLHVQMSDL